MSKYEVLAIIKNANIIVDKMNTLDVDSEEYDTLDKELGWTLDRLFDSGRRYNLHLSPKTGHYYIRF